ncbi:membrane hypothetical protein [Microbacterium sp. C448]|uniref:VanZ family protein n=1 Tax=Microbacterium sp. C448 TaxID=1177594 RepID=UPI0003DE106D|nr:VanZ family protein [Microbacterium sp. C448]CDJ99618.1 membrane hypothetical protein [Microbacterium sp. C448]
MRPAQQAQQAEHAPQAARPPSAPASSRPVWLTRTLWVALIVYGITLATIALWPTHVDAPASGMLSAITRAIPWLTYARMEFTANILLFVPFGALAMLLLPRVHWWYALVAALAFSTTAELLQMLATDRTSSIQDVVANTFGAAIGILAVTLRAKNAKPQGRPIP